MQWMCFLDVTNIYELKETISSTFLKYKQAKNSNTVN